MDISTSEGINRPCAAHHHATQVLMVLVGLVLSNSASGWAQSKSSTPTVENARQRYLGKNVSIIGPHESSSPGLLALYINWRSAERGDDGRYRPQSAENWRRLPFGYERHAGSIIAVQLSDKQPKGPWTHDEKENGPSFDFIVRFDDGVIAMCTSPLDLATSNFQVVGSASTKK